MFNPCRRVFSKSMTVNWIRHRARRYPLPVEFMRENLAKTDQDDESPFPILNRLGTTTADRVHQLNIKCEDAMRMIFFGAINKNLATQYCHYLAHLAREGIEPDYYSEKCFEILTYLLKNPKDVLPVNLDNLMCDVANSSSRNCGSICDRLINLDRFNGLNSKQVEAILDTCYKFNLWDRANSLIQKVHPDQISVSLIERLTSRIIDSAAAYQNLEDETEKKRLQKSILKQLIHVVELCFNNKFYFLTKFRDKFIKSLIDLGLNITVNTTIKLSGRCVTCGNHLPLYDGEKTSSLNSTIEEVMNRGSEKGLYYYTNPKELPKFKQFLASIEAMDKRPIGFVIDGLNVGYKNNTGFNLFTIQITDEVKKTIKKHRPESKVQVIINTILRSNMIHQKILVIGKHHMKRWPGLIDFFDKYNIHYFLSTDSSEDDLFQLFAATLSSKTLLVSNDQYRDIQSKHEKTFKENMREWLDTHQVTINPENLKAIMPTPFLKFPSVNKRTNTMHLPVTDYTLIGEGDPPLSLNSKAIKWICCRYENIDTET